MSAILRSEIARANSVLAESGFPDSGHEVEIIFSEVLSIPRLELYLDPETRLTGGQLAAINEMISRRATGEPLQYILRKAWFRNLELEVGPGVLIPRPETELLAGHLCRLAPENSRICELGSGSGALSLAIGEERPDTIILSIEISPEAVRYAETNRRRHHLNNVNYVRGNLLSPVKESAFQVICGNLPYITDEEFTALPGEVRRFEPALALHGGDDGLDLIGKVIRMAPDYLVPGGFLALEIGETQGEKVVKSCRDAGKYCNIRLENDLNGRDRFVIAEKVC